MTSYHFDFGNSTNGPIGMCARVKAKNKKDALKILQERLDKFVNEVEIVRDQGQIEYVCIYLSPENMTVQHIDQVSG